MADYYLIAQLPSLDGIGDNAPMPINEEGFIALCRRFLKENLVAEIEKITLLPQLDVEKLSSPLINSWNERERDFRIALAKVRADKMNKQFNAGSKEISSDLVKVASEALEIENPLEAEKFLLKFRLNFLETLRPINNFTNDYLFYYALKLKLIMRIRTFDCALGKDEYTKIYNAILSGNSSEAVR